MFSTIGRFNTRLTRLASVTSLTTVRQRQQRGFHVIPEKHIQHDMEALVKDGSLRGRLSKELNQKLFDENKISQVTKDKLDAEVDKMIESESELCD